MEEIVRTRSVELSSPKRKQGWGWDGVKPPPVMHDSHVREPRDPSSLIERDRNRCRPICLNFGGEATEKRSVRRSALAYRRWFLRLAKKSGTNASRSSRVPPLSPLVIVVLGRSPRRDCDFGAVQR